MYELLMKEVVNWGIDVCSLYPHCTVFQLKYFSELCWKICKIIYELFKSKIGSIKKVLDILDSKLIEVFQSQNFNSSDFTEI